MKYLFLLLSFINFAQNQKFIPIDEDTLEFIGEVNYTLYSNKNPIYSNSTSKDSITRLPNNIVFDSIAFQKFNYKETGYTTENLHEVVRLTKVTYDLDEVIISNVKQKEIIVGEQSRFVKRWSRILLNENNYGILFRELDLKNKSINRLDFFVEKVKYKTTYKIKFYAAEETGNPLTYLTLQLNELVFESPILTLETGTKNKVEIDLKQYDINLKNKNIFVYLELQSYCDESNTVIESENKDKTRLKFQLSKLINYYGRMVDFDTKTIHTELINMNAMTNRDFAFMFYKKPHKSALIAPAIILYATKISDEK